MSLGTLLVFVRYCSDPGIYISVHNQLSSLSEYSLSFNCFWGNDCECLYSYQAVYVNKALKQTFDIYKVAKIDRNILIDELNSSLKWADIVHKEGPVGLDNYLKNEEPDDRLLSFGIDLILRQYEPEEIRGAYDQYH